MKHIVLLLLLLALTIASPVLTTTEARNSMKPGLVSLGAPGNQRYVPGEIIVRFQSGLSLSPSLQVTFAGESVYGTAMAADQQRLQGLFDALAANTAEPLRMDRQTYRVQFDPYIDAEQLAQVFETDPAVELAQPNYVRQMLLTSNDEAVGQQWALENIQAFAAWDITTGANIPLAILDTGVSSGHPDLAGKVQAGYNAIMGDAYTEDDNGHGTAIAGIMAATTNNGAGIAGVCWGCTIVPVKVLDGNGSGNDATVSDGIRWATDNGVRVINLSLGGQDDSRILREAIDYAVSRGVVVTAASGNEGEQGNPVSYPAAYGNVIAVSATGNTDAVTSFSNTGEYIDLSAPGVGLWTTILDGQYGTPNGTSFSSPHVAAVVGLVLTVRGDLGPSDIQCVLEASADDKGPPGKDAEYGSGRLNARQALELAQGYTTCPLNAPPEPEPQPEPEPMPQPEPDPNGAPSALLPVSPVPTTADMTYFPETQHTLSGEFKRFWETHGGLTVFGYPISEPFVELGDDGNGYTVQYFERHRFELHPQNPAPYNVQITRLGDLILLLQDRSWFTLPKGSPTSGCKFFPTEHNLCEPFLSYWHRYGLEFDGQSGKSEAENLALFGNPISEPQVEEIAPGVFVTVQWFERARFEFHADGQVRLGLLGNELVEARGWRGEQSLP
ncbi:MAG: peptidase S8 [Chloroflexaceae bacterium]|nr:peptidase S8 [Chloroflexaceae bacterium]